MSRTFYLLVALSVFGSSCVYENEESLYPRLAECDTVSVTFSGSISPILVDNCILCHSNEKADISGSGIRLEGYSNVVIMQDAIRNSINHNASYSPMPKDAPKLKDCQIRQFEIWVDSGSPDN